MVATLLWWCSIPRAGHARLFSLMSILRTGDAATYFDTQRQLMALRLLGEKKTQMQNSSIPSWTNNISTTTKEEKQHEETQNSRIVHFQMKKQHDHDYNGKKHNKPVTINDSATAHCKWYCNSPCLVIVHAIGDPNVPNDERSCNPPSDWSYNLLHWVILQSTRRVILPFPWSSILHPPTTSDPAIQRDDSSCNFQDNSSCNSHDR